LSADRIDSVDSRGSCSMLFANSIAYGLCLLIVVRQLRLHLILEMLDFTLELAVFVFLAT